jgi:hypothetical protein
VVTECNDAVCVRGVCEIGHVGVVGMYCLDEGGTRLRSWLRHCAASREVAAPIRFVVVGIFH